jgi:CBS domain-containing protein
MKTARQLMDEPVVVGPHTSLRELAARLLETRADGACVVEAGRLVGVVTTMDLIFREKKVHLPTLFTLLDAVIPLGSFDRVDAEVARIAAANVGELMTRDVVTVGPDTPLDELATRMVEDSLTLLPVVDGGALLGVVTKASLLSGSSLLRPPPASDGGAG